MFLVRGFHGQSVVNHVSVYFYLLGLMIYIDLDELGLFSDVAT